MRVEPFSLMTLMLSTTPGHNFVLESDVLTLSVFAHDDQVNARPVRRQPRQILDRAEICEQVEFFAQRDVDALEAAADGRGHGALESHAIALDRLVERRGNVLAMNLEGFSSRRVPLPIKFRAACLKNANDRLRNFRADAVAGDQRYFVRLLSVIIPCY